MIADGLSRIAMSSGLAASLSRATDYARAHGHAEVTLEHMLLALCDDPDAVLVLAASNVNVEELTGEVTTQLAALPSRPHATDIEFAVAPDMRRILEAAAAAARGGRRREINGAIVLAAIVGDGKSAAAQVLSALGLTFEGAIRALQSKPAPAAEQRQLPAPDAEAILAGARERVQSRTGVTARRLPIDEGAYEEVAEPAPLHVEQARALPPPAYEPEPPEPEQSVDGPYHHDYEQAQSYEPQADPAFEPAPAAEPDRHHEVEPQYAPVYEPEPRFEESLRASRTTADAASAPVPPPFIGTTRHHRTRPRRDRRSSQHGRRGPTTIKRRSLSTSRTSLSRTSRGATSTAGRRRCRPRHRSATAASPVSGATLTPPPRGPALPPIPAPASAAHARVRHRLRRGRRTVGRRWVSAPARWRALQSSDRLRPNLGLPPQAAPRPGAGPSRRAPRSAS